jgi:RNA polymerase sigma factor (sigma-70 family)
MTEAADELVERAKGGDAAALEDLVRALKDDVYNLALRMLWHPADAEDATQEILIKLVTRLGSFRGESSIRTWAFRVAANHLLTARRRRAEHPELTFTAFADDLTAGLDTPYDSHVDERLLAEEVKIGCTQGMLLCLDREHRLAYILAEVTGEQAAEVLDIAPAAYRKRLSRARARLQRFMRRQCGMVDPANSCRCQRRIGRAIALGRLDPEHLLFAGTPHGSTALRAGVEEMERLHDAAAVFRSHPVYAAPDRLANGIRTLLGGDRFPRLVDDGEPTR